MNKLYNDTAVRAIANAIRSKNGSSDTYTIAEMSAALNDLSYYAKPIISNVQLATFEADGLPLNSLKVSVEAKQEGSGTPSPENVRPISGWDAANVSDVGKNLFDTTTSINNIYINDNGEEVSYPNWYASTYIAVAPNTKMTFNPNSSAGAVAKHAFYNGNKEFISTINSGEQTFTTPSNCKYMRFSYRNDSTDVQLYINQTTTISLPQTVYGGEVDVVNGGGTDKLGAVDMGNLTWYYSSGQRRFSTPSLADVIKSSSGRSAEGLLCSCFECTIDGTDSFLFQSGTSIYVYASDYTDASAFTTAVTGQTLQYELATPTTFTTQPTPIKSLNGQNNLSVDCGEVIELEYIKEV